MDEEESPEIFISFPVWQRCCNTLEEMLRDRGWGDINWQAPCNVMYTQFCGAHSLSIIIATATNHVDREKCSCGKCVLQVFACLTKNLTSPSVQNIEALRQSAHTLVLFKVFFISYNLIIYYKFNNL